MADDTGTSTPPKPDYLVKAEHEQAALADRKERLFAMHDAGKVTEEQFQRRYQRLLEREAIAEIRVNALTASWETFEQGGD
jgi:hypothetical protein